MMLLHVTYLGHLFFPITFTYPTKSSITPPTPHVSQPPQITHEIIPNHHKTPFTATIGHYIHSPHHHIITKPHITPSSFQPSKPQFLYQLTIFFGFRQLHSAHTECSRLCSWAFPSFAGGWICLKVGFQK
jgi:hypothetical protein